MTHCQTTQAARSGFAIPNARWKRRLNFYWQQGFQIPAEHTGTCSLEIRHYIYELEYLVDSINVTMLEVKCWQKQNSSYDRRIFEFQDLPPEGWECWVFFCQLNSHSKIAARNLKAMLEFPILGKTSGRSWSPMLSWNLWLSRYSKMANGIHWVDSANFYQYLNFSVNRLHLLSDHLLFSHGTTVSFMRLFGSNWRFLGFLSL